MQKQELRKAIKTNQLLLVAGVFMLFGIAPAIAAEKASEEEFDKVQEEILKTRAQSEELKARSDEILADLKELQKELVKSAARIQENEQKLTGIETELAELTTQAQNKNEELEAKRKELSGSIAAMVKLGIRPPETVIAMPGEAKNTVIASKALGLIVKDLKVKSEEIRLALIEIENISSKIQEKKEQLVLEKESLDKNSKELDEKLAERSKLQRQTLTDLRKTQQMLEELSKKSENMKELIGRIEDARKTDMAKRKAAEREQEASEVSANLKLPVSGKVISNFGDRLEKNNTSKGIRIKTRDSAQVTSPADGEVAFTGPFMRYGKILIIRHNGGYHSLISGMKKIDVLPGQKLDEGEPIGVMGSSKEGSDELYLELRKNNKPVDPSTLLAQKVGKVSE